MPSIQISTGIINYKIRPLYLGVKRIDKTKAFENLLLLKTILDKQNIFFGLIAGTLLGAVREHDFIDHDEDIDLFFFNEDKYRVLNILPQILDVGFEIARYDRRGLLSIIRNGEYIDMYFFELIEEKIRNCCGWCIPNLFFNETVSIEFKGEVFFVPKNYKHYLVYEYGKNWETPIPWTDFKIPSWKRRLYELKEHMKYWLPQFVFDYFSKRAEIKMEKKYKKKLKSFFADYENFTHNSNL